MDGVPWASFETAAPALAADIKRLIERHRFALMGTIRLDGTPRISPVETHLINDELMLVLIPGSHKAADLRRDQRLVLQSPITDREDPGTEFKIRGRARAVDNVHQRDATADAVKAVSGWRPHTAWLFVAVIFEHAACISWRRDGTAWVATWSVDHISSDAYEIDLDVDKGRYVRR